MESREQPQPLRVPSSSLRPAVGCLAHVLCRGHCSPKVPWNPPSVWAQFSVGRVQWSGECFKRFREGVHGTYLRTSSEDRPRPSPEPTG